MLQIIVPGIELWDEENNEFVFGDEQKLNLEHSLFSISKWEAKWRKPYFSTTKEKTEDEIIDYIRCMTLNEDVDQSVYNRLSRENADAISKYLEEPMTATYLSKINSSGKSTEIITAELIYYWMVALTIPVEQFEHWHINRLLTFIEVCNRKNQPPKKMSRRDIISRNASLNAARRKSLNTRG